MAQLNRLFGAVATKTSHFAGKPQAFALTLFIIVVWGAFGPSTHYSDTWQLILNTGGTIVTLLLVILLQYTQNRDTAAIQLKLNELILVNNRARNTLVDVDKMTEQELNLLYANMHERMARSERRAAAKADKTENSRNQ